MNIVRAYHRDRKAPFITVFRKSESAAIQYAKRTADEYPGADVVVQTFTNLKYKAHFITGEQAARNADIATAFIAHWEGKIIPDDGVYGPQSPPVFAQYVLEAVGEVFVPGNACDIYRSPYLPATLQRVPASHPGRYGDFAFFSEHQGFGYGHTGLVVRDDGIALQLFSQGPGPAGVQTILKTGLQGYLRRVIV